MANVIYHIPKPINEPVYSYEPGSPEATALKNELTRLRESEIEIPLIIGGEEIKTGNLGECIVPHDHGHRLATYHKASEKEVQMAISATGKAAKSWAAMSWMDRLAVFEKAAALISEPYRMLMNASTMLGQSKTVHQTEIDSACEIIDFLRFNAYYASQIFQQQPDSTTTERNLLEYRPLEGFVLAVSPFNFTAIGANLSAAPAMLGNTVIWKPASSAVFSAYFLMKIFMEAGLPDGVINFLPGPGSSVGQIALESPHLAGVHFTGSTNVFHTIWKTIGTHIDTYRNYPRIVGETGGKDFIFAHPSADVEALVTAMVRGAFEYQGQKCSAASRAYIPRSMWTMVREKLTQALKTIKAGDPADFSTFFSAVIDRSAFQSIIGYIQYAHDHKDAEILIGGDWNDNKGFFIEPTVIQAKTPDFKTMTEEIFGPVLTIYVYDDNDYNATLRLCDETSAYGLTGAIFARDRMAIDTARRVLVNAAGNFYINDKPTGAVVGQQPFGGGRASGTNDKAGSFLNLFRWLSPRTIKENYNPPHDFRYPHMG